MESKEFCTKCGHVTTWKGSAKRQACQECHSVFPCHHDCNHYDCKLEKGLAKLCSCNMIVLLGKKCCNCKKEPA